jgi:signal transduction histidine kinase
MIIRLRPGHWLAADRIAACGYGLAALPLAVEHVGLLAAPLLVCFSAPVALRRPHPVMSLVVLLAGIAPIAAWRPELLPVGMVPVGYVLYTAASLRAGTAIPALAASVTAALAPALPDFRHAGGPVLFTLAYLTVWMVGFGVGMHRRYTASLLDGQARLAAAELAEERLRIARELHDVVAHSMSVIAVQAGYGTLVINDRPEAAHEALTVIETAGREALTEMRRMVGMLRPTAGAELGPAPGLGDLSQLIERSAEAGVRVTVRTMGTPRALPAGVDVCVYRIVQEALTNVAKHAAADTAQVSIDYRDGELVIEVVDTGQGGGRHRGDAGARHGIAGMRERARLCGGWLEAEPLPDEGFRVRACLPMELEPSP